MWDVKPILDTPLLISLQCVLPRPECTLTIRVCSHDSSVLS
jgi:hypothetical protein